MIDVDQQRYEFIPTLSADGVRLAHATGQALAHGLQQLVTHAMAQRVVDVLECVQVHE